MSSYKGFQNRTWSWDSLCLYHLFSGHEGGCEDIYYKEETMSISGVT